MNQHQRKFLLDEIEKQYRRELDELNKRRPSAPSLNNYLIAAVLDGTAQLKPQDEFRERMRAHVRDLGKDDAFIERGSTSGWGRRSNEEEREDKIAVPALLLFEAPPEYAKKRAEYAEALAKWEEEKKSLDASINAMRIKVQVGSDKSLSLLVDQADKLCSMSLTSSSTLLLKNAS